MEKDELKDWIRSHEGYSKKIYKCPAGANTIAWGRNLDELGVSVDEAELMLDNDIKRCIEQLEKYAWYNMQPSGVRAALINMCFNLGINRLLGFKKMIAALGFKDYRKAAIEALNSLWADQVGKRANDVALMIREGK